MTKALAFSLSLSLFVYYYMSLATDNRFVVCTSLSLFLVTGLQSKPMEDGRRTIADSFVASCAQQINETPSSRVSSSSKRRAQHDEWVAFENK